MIIQTVENEIKEGTKNDYILAAKNFTNDLAKVNGCISSSVLLDNNEENKNIFIVTIWADETSMDSEEHATIFQAHKANLRPFFVGNTTTILKEV